MYIIVKINLGDIIKLFFYFKGEVLFFFVVCKLVKEYFLFKQVIISFLYCIKNDNFFLGGFEILDDSWSNIQLLVKYVKFIQDFKY